MWITDFCLKSQTEEGHWEGSGASAITAQGEYAPNYTLEN